MELSEKQAVVTPHFRVTCKWASSYKSRHKWFSEQQEAVDYAESRLEALRRHPTAGPKINSQKVVYDQQEVVDYSGSCSSPSTVLFKLVRDKTLKWDYSGKFSVLVEHRKAGD